MEQIRHEAIICMVDNILEQYLDQLQAHREWAVSNYDIKSPKYEDNVEKCDKGILYAQRIKDDLPTILTRSKLWSRKELIYRYSRGYTDTYAKYSNKRVEGTVFAQNVEIVLNSMGLRTWEMLPSIAGYVLDRTNYDRGLITEENKPSVHKACMGRLTVNYGKPRDFDVFDKKCESANFNLDLRPMYKLAKKYFLNKLTAITHHAITPAPNEYFNAQLLEFLNELNFGPGSYTRSTSEVYRYQKDYVDFIKDIKGYGPRINPHYNYNATDGEDMVI